MFVLDVQWFIVISKAKAAAKASFHRALSALPPNNQRIQKLYRIVIGVIVIITNYFIETMIFSLFTRNVEACHARGIASNDNEWCECLNETKELHSPKQMRNLFGYICALNVPANALALWNEFKVHILVRIF